MSTEENEEPGASMEGLSKPEHGDSTVTLSAPLEELIPLATRNALADAPPLQTTVEVKGPGGETRILAQGSYDEAASARAMSAGRALIANAAEARRKQTNALDYNSEVISYVECKRCMGPGIWMHGDPFAMRDDSSWESTYHQRGAFWSPREQPFCQMCHSVNGARNPLRTYAITRGQLGAQTAIGFLANPRFVRSLTMTQYKQLVGEPAKEEQHV